MIEPATATDLEPVRDLLGRCHLPLDGIDDHVGSMLVAREAGRVIGSAALELYGEGALLRSVAVDPSWQGRGLGHQLTEAALDLAKARGVRRVFLLTTTAEGFFPKHGFRILGRGDVPAAVQESVEFRSACPASAIVMGRTL